MCCIRTESDPSCGASVLGELANVLILDALEHTTTRQLDIYTKARLVQIRQRASLSTAAAVDNEHPPPCGGDDPGAFERRWRADRQVVRLSLRAGQRSGAAGSARVREIA